MSKSLQNQYLRFLREQWDRNAASLPEDRRPVRFDQDQLCCKANEPLVGFNCTLPRGHGGKHAAHGGDALIIEQWSDDDLFFIMSQSRYYLTDHETWSAVRDQRHLMTHSDAETALVEAMKWDPSATIYREVQS